MKIKYVAALSTLAATMFTAGSYASTLLDDTRAVSGQEINVSELKYKPVNRTLAKVSTAAIASSDAAHNADLVVFYQPSYAAKYGEYAMYRRIDEIVSMINKTYEFHGHSDFKLVVKDVVATTSVPDSAPYQDVLDSNGNVITYGADGLFSSAVLNEVNDDFELNPEYDIYQNKWSGDLVLYIREYRPTDDQHVGFASVGGEYSSVLDTDGTPSEQMQFAHEIGHNLGMNHEKGQANSGAEYARAWICGGKKTIMHSVGGGALKHYSSPLVSYLGSVCGVDGEADNARVLAENFIPTTQRRASVVSNGEVSFSTESFNGNESEGVQITLTRNGDVTESASVKLFAENGSAVWGEDFTDAYIEANFAAGETETTVTYPMVFDAVAEDAESFTVSLKYPYKLTVGATSTATVYVADANQSGSAGLFSISSQADVLAGETALITVTRSGGIGEAVISVKTADGTALAGRDYVGINQQVVFKAGDVEKNIALTTIANSSNQRSANLTVSISSTADNAEFNNSTVAVQVINDSVEPELGSFSLVAGSLSIPENAGKFTFKVTRSDNLSEPHTVRVFTEDGTKKAGVNYKAIDIELVFAAGESEKDVSIEIIDNSQADASGTFTVSLDGKGAETETNNITVTITNNDSQPAEPVESGSSGGSFNWLLLSGLMLLVRFRKRKY